jgi:hypothetical protein
MALAPTARSLQAIKPSNHITKKILIVFGAHKPEDVCLVSILAKCQKII